MRVDCIILALILFLFHNQDSTAAGLMLVKVAALQTLEQGQFSQKSMIFSGRVFADSFKRKWFQIMLSKFTFTVNIIKF